METAASNQETLAELQKIEFDLLKQVVEICEQHNIEYYLGFGTLLGAVRHKGFIPWDDDIDLFMTRTSVRKFLALSQAELSETIRIKTYENNSSGSKDIKLQPKVETTKKKVIRQIGGRKIEQNVWIDIFVIDGMPNNKVLRMLHYYNLKFHHILCRVARSAENGTSKSKQRGKLEAVAVKLLDLIPLGKLLDPKKCMKSTDRLLEKYDTGKNQWAITFAPDYGKKCIVPTKAFEKKIEMQFENGEFWVPSGYDTLLMHWYGNYMTPPPPEKRVAKHIAGIVND